MKSSANLNFNQGVFTVSIDFELYWGIRDNWTIEQYKNNLDGVSDAIPEILKVFNEYDIHATWATVGFLFFKSSDDLKENIPDVLPNYNNEKISPYKYINEAINLDSKYHFAPKIIDLINNCSGQEIGSHSFSHYYCIEEGQSVSEFENDMLSSVEIAKKKGIHIKSFVFPRNQYRIDYLSTLSKLGIECFRGNESSWIYNNSQNSFRKKTQRILRLMDSYFNISGNNTYSLKNCFQKKPFNFPSSRFLRPYSPKFSALESLRFRRIKKAMDNAAINNELFHIWWHPHNFGIHRDENIEFLSKILGHYNFLKNKYGMKSLNMGELAQLY
tara:strand:- start:1591 stop:2577 length:987 start_codon:yes stop_codon:yes gene_type:complete